MTDIAEPQDEDTDVIRNPGGEAADAEADEHGDHLAAPDDVELGDEADA